MLPPRAKMSPALFHSAPFPTAVPVHSRQPHGYNPPRPPPKRVPINLNELRGFTNHLYILLETLGRLSGAESRDEPSWNDCVHRSLASRRAIRLAASLISSYSLAVLANLIYVDSYRFLIVLSYFDETLKSHDKFHFYCFIASWENVESSKMQMKPRSAMINVTFS